MRFDGTVGVENAATTANPDTDPEDVPAKNTFVLPEVVGQAGSGPCRRLLLSLVAPAAETVTVEVWVQVEPPAAPGRAPLEPDPANRIWILVAAASVVTARRMTEIVAGAPVGGRVYIRQTADALTGTGTVVVACAG